MWRDASPEAIRPRVASAGAKRCGPLVAQGQATASYAKRGLWLRVERSLGYFVHVVELGVLDGAPQVVGVGGHPPFGGEFLHVGVVGQSEEDVRRFPVPNSKRRFLVHYRDGVKWVWRCYIGPITEGVGKPDN